MIDQSRPVLYPPGTLVKRRNYATSGVYVVDHNSDEDTCHLMQAGYLTQLSEKAVRRLTFGEFLWYKDPTTGGMKIGKNRALPLLLAVAILAAGSIASLVGVEDGWKWFCPALLGTVITGTLVATYRNYTGKQS